ncbi:autotransporter domain-containing protein [Variovorax boronicumulans]|uniref:autotransporter domain-containing protein n=1 Tax=Variovorax boronicumulans TaxID=436515 RepID=UPI00133002D1|nr:autotransporter domain-containing protein [Variovorax boronicumulans]
MTRSPKFKRRAVARAAVCVLGSMLATAAGAQAYPGDPGMIGDPASWRTKEFLADWGLGAMKTEYAYAAGFTGKGVKLGVIDSGFDVRHTRELPLTRFTALVTATSNGAYSEFAADGSVLNGKDVGYGFHGTHVSGTVGASRDGQDVKNNMHGVAFNANVFVGNTNAPDALSSSAGLSPDSYPLATTENFRNLYQGMRDAGVRVINNSWGNPSNRNFSTQNAVTADYLQYLRGPSWVDAAIDATKPQADGKEGVIQVFAADNQGQANPAARGALPYFRPDVEGHWLTVTGASQTKTGYQQHSSLNKCGIAKYWCVATPGAGITSTVFDGAYGTYTGTSMAAPHATGALGVIMERFPYMTNEQALQVLLTTATKLDGSRQAAPDAVIGWGLVNLENAMKGPGQLLKRTVIDMPGGASDTWRNDISETGLIQRKQEEAAEIVRLGALVKGPIAPDAFKPLGDEAVALLQALRTAMLSGGDFADALAAAKANPLAKGTAEMFESLRQQVGPADPLWTQLPPYMVVPTDDIMATVEDRARAINVEWDRLTHLRSKTDEDYRGSLVKAGAGRLVLTGTNTYSGDTHVQAGELALGEGGTTGSITSHVAIDAGATFAIDRSDAYDFTYNITGAGDLRTTGGTTGEGVTTLSGANSYSGATWVQGGTLRAGSATGLSNASAFTVAGKARLDLNGFDATIGSLAGAGDVAVGTGTLTTGGNDRSTQFAGRFSGSGGLVKAGAGRFELTGDSGAFTGKTSVAQGMLSVNGTLGGEMAVLSGGRLQGTGTVGSTTVATGGVVAPGNSIGTLHVAGNARFAPGSTFEAELSGTDAQADRLDVSGQATLDGGTVRVLGGYVLGARYTLLNAEGGVSGTFADFSVAKDYLFLSPKLGYTATQVYTEAMRNSVSFASVAQSGNQRAMGANLDGAAAWSPALAAALQLESVPAARAAFDSLSGEVHASAKTALIEDSRFVREAAMERLRASAGTAGASTAPVKINDGAGQSHMAAPTTGEAVFWSQALHSTGRARGDGNAARLDRSVDGLLMGGDVRVGDNARLGVTGGYSRSKFDVDARSSSGDATSYHLGLYGGTTLGPWALRAGAAYARHDVDTTRQARVAGLADSIKSNHDASTTQVFGEVGYSLAAGDVALEPFANLAHVTLHTDAFSERGTWAALQARSGSANVGLSTLGLRASTALRLGSVDATLKGMVGWRRAYGDLTPFTSVALSGATGFSDIAGVAIAKNAAVLQLGLDFAFSPRATFGVSYGGQFGGKARDQSVKANLNVSF